MADDPLRITTIRLTRTDAFAYEQAAARNTPLGTAALVLWLGLWALAAFFLPADWRGSPLGWTFPILLTVSIAVGYVLVVIAVSLRQWQAAGRRIPRPVEFTVTEWPDRLEIAGGTGLPPTFPIRDIRESILAADHLFLVGDTGLLILPRAAFEDDEAIDSLAARIAGKPLPGAEPPPPLYGDRAEGERAKAKPDNANPG